jgi:molybdopterin-containing oxidoreductase family iron-sulfur binding subunit
MMGRSPVKETILSKYIKEPNAGNEAEMFSVKVGKEETKKSASQVNLWDSHEIGNHHWGMSIDLNSCVGCGSCVVACTAENNVPVVGKLEVSRSREMHWIRIDRYYTSDADPKEHEKGDLKAMESPSDNPKVVFQPVMCQHCNHAPCETVCPVIATNHSSEGLNQMAYNRCVGTRYCANNCPYKVRRFNWFKYSDNPQFDYNMNDDLGKMVLNPDVVVRSRGVMEKCSMCVQRLQEGKLNAKKVGRKVKEGEINTACAQACPTQAITFGDYLNKDSALNKMWNPEERSYHLLEELDVQPNVFYQVKVWNREDGETAENSHKEKKEA